MESPTEKDYLEYCNLMKRSYVQMIAMAIKMNDNPTLGVLGAFGILFGAGTSADNREALEAMRPVIERIKDRMEGERDEQDGIFRDILGGSDS